MMSIGRVIPLRVLGLLLVIGWAASLSEEVRMEEYHKRGYKWPLEKVVPDTPGWDKIMRRRFEQIGRVEDSNAKYNGWLAFMTSALVATNFTENGWGFTRAPEHITQRLKRRLHATIDHAQNTNATTSSSSSGQTAAATYPRGTGTRTEHYVNVIEAESHARPIMISDVKENDEILLEMKPMFEWWSGQDLIGSIAYGIRSYKNDSNLLMHVDKSTTHVISGIFHIDHSEDSEPWPIIIEDFQGNTNQVYMESGDILFYESSKCFHGRPQTFIGSYYASLFMHYRPVDHPINEIDKEIHYAVPEHWNDLQPPKEGLDELVMVGTSFKEPNCKNLLCSVDENNPNSQSLVNWYGPAPKGKIVTAGWDPITMTPPHGVANDYDGAKKTGHIEAKQVLEGISEEL